LETYIYTFPILNLGGPFDSYYDMCIFVDVDGEEEGGDVAAVAPPPKRSLSVKPKRKVKGRGGKKGGARRGRKGTTAAAARKLTPIPILEEKEGKQIGSNIAA
jgi:hypothetical protein